MARIARALHAAAALALATAAAMPAASAAAPGWAWPVRGEVLTEYRNGGDPYAGGQHRGIDIAATAGEPVVAAAGGTVRFAGVAGSSGLTVSVRTSDGELDTSYLHLASIDASEGDEVARGQRIGTVGTSGDRSSTAPHLHFGVRDAGSRHSYRNPLDLLPGSPPARERPRGAPVPVRSPVRVLPGPALSPLATAEALSSAPAAPAPGLALDSPPRLGPAPSPSAPSPSTRPAGAVVDAWADRPLVEPPEEGLDLAWALACAGLLAAAVLGRPRRSRPDRARSARPRAGRLLPLLGRR